MGELRIGWLNGWVYSALLMAVTCSAYVFARRMTSFAWMSKRQLLVAGMADVITTGLCIYTIWKPIIYPGMLFWAGNVLYALGLIAVILSIHAFATTPSDQPVTRGIYAALRHPYYVGSYLCLVGIALICRDPAILLIAVASMVPGYCSAKWEEQYLEETFGHAHTDSTPPGAAHGA
jgi:protein-S-isoprenylcysteine O-methyltransferase Ste14